MIAKRIVVIGASAGGIDALRTLLAGIPETFPAAICIVLHTAPESPGVVPEILDRVAQIPVAVAVDGQRLEERRAYVAPPGRHLLVEPGRLRLTLGPSEHRFRPAIDPLFRSAAQVFGPAAIGVVLTGNLDDGTAGLWTIKKLGGTAIVQEPAEAPYPSMVLSALNNVEVDHVAPVSRISSLLIELAADEPKEPVSVTMPRHVEVDLDIAKGEHPLDAGLEHVSTPSRYACPECHGVLLELKEDARIRFRCHIGHAYSIESLLAAMTEGSELAMGAAVRALEESRMLMTDVASRLEGHGQHAVSRRLSEAADRAKRRAETIRELILERDAVPTAHE